MDWRVDYNIDRLHNLDDPECVVERIEPVRIQALKETDHLLAGDRRVDEDARRAAARRSGFAHARLRHRARSFQLGFAGHVRHSLPTPES